MGGWPLWMPTPFLFHRMAASWNLLSIVLTEASACHSCANLLATLAEAMLVAWRIVKCECTNSRKTSRLQMALLSKEIQSYLLGLPTRKVSVVAIRRQTRDTD